MVVVVVDFNYVGGARGMEEASALVHALCSCGVSPLSSPLLHA